MTPRSVVVAGSGQAGFQVAASLRENGYEGRIVLVGDEPGLPYQRPPLSKAYLKSGLRQTVELRPESFFERNRIDLETGVRIARIHRHERRIELQDGRGIAYDRLVLALGARNRFPPIEGIELANVLDLRTITDADRLRGALAAASRIVVVGGGFIGLEVAAVARASGKDVTVVEAMPRLLGRTVSALTAKFVLESHLRDGIDIRLDAKVESIAAGPAGAAAGVRLDDGAMVEGDLVLLAVGVVPNVELARDAGLAIANGIRVDHHLMTDDPAIAAIGDCAGFPAGPHGAHVRLESVQNAVDQGKAVAQSLLDRPSAYRRIPWFWSDQGATRLQIAGLTIGATDFRRADAEGEGRHVVHCFRGRIYVGTETVNAPREHMMARRHLEAEQRTGA